jgi:hypothetical protein
MTKQYETARSAGHCFRRSFPSVSYLSDRSRKHWAAQKSRSRHSAGV